MKKLPSVSRSKSAVIKKKLHTTARVAAIGMPSRTRAKSMSKERDDESVSVGSGNVFADLGLANAHEKLTKARLTAAIAKAIERRAFKNQSEVARALGIDQPKVSKLLRGHFSEYSVERLLGFLTQLGCDVRIEVTDRAERHRAGHVDVIA